MQEFLANEQTQVMTEYASEAVLENLKDAASTSFAQATQALNQDVYCSSTSNVA